MAAAVAHEKNPRRARRSRKGTKGRARTAPAAAPEPAAPAAAPPPETTPAAGTGGGRVPANPYAELERREAKAKAVREAVAEAKNWNPWGIPKEGEGQ
jgi:hypothetical protein